MWKGRELWIVVALMAVSWIIVIVLNYLLRGSHA
jgi:hypothetical protein